MKKMMGIISALLVIGVIGCAELREYVDMAGDKGVSREYRDALNAWTRTRTVLSQFETKVVISATLKNAAFRKAYGKEYERLYPLPASDSKAREDLQAGLAADFTEFLFYANTPSDDANDFDQQNSLWTVYLCDDRGNWMAPLEIRRITKITPLIEAFYPYVRPYYGKFYSLKFAPLKDSEGKPDAAAKKSYVLVFTSVLARVELEWK
jgi:hypothetical protein